MTACPGSSGTGMDMGRTPTATVLVPLEPLLWTWKAELCLELFSGVVCLLSSSLFMFPFGGHLKKLLGQLSPRVTVPYLSQKRSAVSLKHLASFQWSDRSLSIDLNSSGTCSREVKV